MTDLPNLVSQLSTCMKIVVLLAVTLLPLATLAQSIKEYKAINGVTYHINDTVRLGKGSKDTGGFLYIEDRGFTLPAPPGARTGGGRGLPKDFANSGVVVKSIRKTQLNGVDKYLFMVNAGGPFRLSMFIDDAILACEVTPCKSNTSEGGAPVADVADEIKKLKALMDSGAITKEEYEARKKKLLNQ